MDKNGQMTSASFEKKIAELQKIVDRLESDSGVSLEESMTLFEDGLTLTKQCVESLSEAQTRITDLNKQLDAILRQSIFGDGNE